MAYLLRLATNGYAQLASTFSVASASSLSVKFKASFTGASEIYGLGTSTAERLRYDGSGFFFRLAGTNGNTITTATIASLVSGYNVANPHEYELRKIPFEDGTRTKYRLFVEGVDCGELMSIFNSGGATFQFNRIGSASTSFFNGDLYYMDCYVDGVKTRSYDPSATGGSGSTLVDTTDGQNGTMNGTYSWVFYSTGGGTITASVAATMPQMAVAAIANKSAPVYTASIATTMPQMAVAAAGQAIAPSSGAVINFTMPQMVAAISASNSVPVFASAASVTMPQFTVSASAENTLPTGGAVVSFAMPQMIVSASVSKTAPTFSASIASTMPQFTVSATGQALVDTKTASISFAMPQMVVASTAGNVVPIRQTSVAFTMPQMRVSVLTGGVAFYNDPRAHVELVAASRHIEYTNQSRHIELRSA